MAAEEADYEVDWQLPARTEAELDEPSEVGDPLALARYEPPRPSTRGLLL